MANIGTSLFGVFYGSLWALAMGFLGVELLSLVLHRRDADSGAVGY